MAASFHVWWIGAVAFLALVTFAINFATHFSHGRTATGALLSFPSSAAADFMSATASELLASASASANASACASGGDDHQNNTRRVDYAAQLLQKSAATRFPVVCPAEEGMFKAYGKDRLECVKREVMVLTADETEPIPNAVDAFVDVTHTFLTVIGSIKGMSIERQTRILKPLWCEVISLL
jgi:NADPH:quinone reductase-like Zn-dependent oxidoreductase